MITYDSVTDKGERKKNEDSIGFIQKENRSVFILADGLGGHGNGDAGMYLSKSKCFA